ncbi:MAG: 7-cyano-7-deazaguanine synthase QueC [Parvibaculum sp.]|nr:7-cyano-7-deazaguanine synthase QueC [Parvibaculum sp.]
MTTTEKTKALVLFSGGQDSTVCLAWALARYDEVETVGFDYGQAHAVELDCRARLREGLAAAFPHWATRLGADHMISLAELGRISDTALTREMEIEMGENGLPTTFVPGRNLLFFTYAAALGYRRGAKSFIGGMCETDYSGYPDCRADTIAALEHAISLGMDRDFALETPLMRIDKAGTWALAEELGGKALVDLILEESHSCYRGDRSKRHDWGYGCGDCPACDLRARGYALYMAAGT